MAADPRPVALVGINHVALEVGDVDEALEFYGRLFEVRLRGRHPGMAFVDIGDQFIALSAGRSQPPDRDRHFGLVVADREAVRELLAVHGVEPLPGRGRTCRDPWGSHVRVVYCSELQLTKTVAILAGLGLDGLLKRPAALEELREKGLGG
jgi:predicted enzyme related to lactoylglutathione lyase